jgi:hypothetical protein
MSTYQESTSPPAYEKLLDSEAASHIFLNRIQNTVNAEYHDVNNDSTETKRLRNFLLYCLAVDYRAPISLTISESDREHFREMSATIWDLQGLDSENLVHLNGKDRQALAPYFWKYLHAPCRLYFATPNFSQRLDCTRAVSTGCCTTMSLAVSLVNSYSTGACLSLTFSDPAQHDRSCWTA